MQIHTARHTQSEGICRGHNDLQQHCEMCLWSRRLDKQDAYMKTNVIRHCTSRSCNPLRFDAIAGRFGSRLAVRGNALTTEFKDSIYGAVTTQIYCSSQRREKKACMLHSAEGVESLGPERLHSKSALCGPSSVILGQLWKVGADSRHASQTALKISSATNCPSSLIRSLVAV